MMKLDILPSDNVTINCITYFRAIYQIKMSVDINGYYLDEILPNPLYSSYNLSVYILNCFIKKNNIHIYYLFFTHIIKLKNLIYQSKISINENH